MTDEEWQEYLQNEREQALAELFSTNRDRLRLALKLRMDPHLFARVDPSDVIQETFVEASDRLDDYLDNPKMAPYLWVRFLVLQRLITVYRKNIEVQTRDARREVSLDARFTDASSVCLASVLAGEVTTPSQAAIREERFEQLRKAIEELDPMDREIIALRHFEQFRNAEVSMILNLQPATASQRYLRALKRLRDVLTNLLNDSGTAS